LQLGGDPVELGVVPQSKCGHRGVDSAGVNLFQKRWVLIQGEGLVPGSGRRAFQPFQALEARGADEHCGRTAVALDQDWFTG
jgi:hypothetical protein